MSLRSEFERLCDLLGLEIVEVDPSEMRGYPFVQLKKSGIGREFMKEHDMGNANNFAGYQKFVNHETGELYGSFEVYYYDPHHENQIRGDQKGWYWWACSPGCLPDGNSNGPFPTAESAYLDAIGD